MQPDQGFMMPAPESEGFSLRRLLSILRRRKYLIAGVMFIITSITVMMVSQITPLYSASTKIVVEPNRQNVVDIESVVSGLTPDYYTTRPKPKLSKAGNLPSRRSIASS